VNRRYEVRTSETNSTFLRGLLATRYSEQATPPKEGDVLCQYIYAKYIAACGTHEYVGELNRQEADLSIIGALTDAL
jgi:hypothetical protein